MTIGVGPGGRSGAWLGFASQEARANGICMRGAFMGLLVILAIVLGSTHASAVVHAHEDNRAQIVDMLDSDHHAIDMPDDAAPDGKGDVTQHHHCSANLSSLASGVSPMPVPNRARPVSALVAALASITGAPLIEPPSA